MLRHLPPLSTLRAFDAAATHLSFSRAAESLFLTHGAVSRAVKTLEDFLGVQLFNRAHRKITLTRAGEIYAEEVRYALNHLRTGAIRLAAESETGVLSVSTMDSFAAKWLLPRLQKFRDSHPDIELRLSVSDGLTDFISDGIDIAIRYGSGGYDGVEYERLMVEDIFPVCSPDLVSGTRPLVTPEDLQHHTLIHDDMRIDWRAWLTAAGISDIVEDRGPSYNLSSFVVQAAIAGEGVALGRGALVADDLAAGRLVQPFVLSLPAPFAYYVVYPRKALERPKVKAFRDWLFAQVLPDESKIPAGPP